MMTPQASTCPKWELQREIKQLQQIANPDAKQRQILAYYRAMYYARFGGRKPSTKY